MRVKEKENGVNKGVERENTKKRRNRERNFRAL